MRENAPVRYSPEKYDEYTANAVRPYDDLLLSRLAAECARPRHGSRGPIEDERTLVDVGTGTARLLVTIAEDRRFDRLRLIGLDLFEDMLAVAQSTVAAAGHADRIALVAGDAHDLPFADGTADFVVSRSTIHHWADPPKAFREIYRVLKPNGVAIIHDVRRNADVDALNGRSRMSNTAFMRLAREL